MRKGIAFGSKAEPTVHFTYFCQAAASELKLPLGPHQSLTPHFKLLLLY